jgi:hypothetical protein
MEYLRIVVKGDAETPRSATRVRTDAAYKLCIATSKHLHRYMQHNGSSHILNPEYIISCKGSEK